MTIYSFIYKCILFTHTHFYTHKHSRLCEHMYTYIYTDKQTLLHTYTNTAHIDISRHKTLNHFNGQNLLSNKLIIY